MPQQKKTPVSRISIKKAQNLVFLMVLNNYPTRKQTFIKNRRRVILMDLESNNEPPITSEPLIIAYYPFRAKGQVCRLLCEYLHLPYQDRFFDPDQWNKFRDTDAKQWIFRDLPFVQDGDFVVTGKIASATYIIEKAKRLDLLGNTIEDRAKLDSIMSRKDVHNAMLGVTCSNRPTTQNCESESKKCKQYYWETIIKPFLIMMERECTLDPWFLPYFTIIDLAIYELFTLMECMFPEEINKLIKLRTIRQRVANIKEIKEYQNSDRAVTERCPLNYFNRFKEEKLKRSRPSSSNNSISSSSSRRRKMDIE